MVSIPTNVPSLASYYLKIHPWILKTVGMKEEISLKKKFKRSPSSLLQIYFHC